MVTANLDEAPFLPDMGPSCQGAFHLRLGDLAETVVGEGAEPSEQMFFGHHLSKPDFFTRHALALLASMALVSKFHWKARVGIRGHVYMATSPLHSQIGGTSTGRKGN